MNERLITKVCGRQVLDSRGNPTVEAEVVLACGAVGRAIAPSGASTGEFEALELRDGDKNVYGGKGVLKAVGNINTEINEAVRGHDGADMAKIDETLLKLDGTPDKSRLGANAILAVSMACAKAGANALQLPLYAFLGGANARELPVPMMNILNGGAHAANTVDTQEFMIMPVGASSFREGLRRCCEVYHTLAGLLKSRGLATSVGDEGGFAPNLESDEQVLETICDAITKAGFRPGEDFRLAMDAAASEWKSPEGVGHYRLPKSGKCYTSDSLIAHWEDLIEKYPIVSIEDGLDEEDWQGWSRMTKQLGNRVQLVGDDLFVTNPERVRKGLALAAGNAVLIKPNQIGTLSETCQTIRLAKSHGLRCIASHRSGETEDVTIADLCVGLNTRQIKTGAPCRSERVSKYNRLLRIEEQLGHSAFYPGMEAFRLG